MKPRTYEFWKRVLQVYAGLFAIALFLVIVLTFRESYTGKRLTCTHSFMDYRKPADCK